jgi:hypothetical protein
VLRFGLRLERLLSAPHELPAEHWEPPPLSPASRVQELRLVLQQLLPMVSQEPASLEPVLASRRL